MTGLQVLHFSSDVVVTTLKLKLKVSTLTTQPLFNFEFNVLEPRAKTIQNLVFHSCP